MRRLIVQLRGGLGNQMFQFAMAFALSQRTRQEIALEVSSFYWDEFGRKYELDVFCHSARVLHGVEAFGLRVLRVLRRRGLHVGPSQLRDQELGYEPLLSKITGWTALSGHWQSYRYFEACESALREQFTFRDEAGPIVAAWIDRIRGETHATSLHVRRTDYVNHPGAARLHGCCDSQYYRRAVNEMLQVGINPSLFIFTDDPEWVRANLRLDAPATIVSEPGRWKDADDLRIMAACRHFITANSSFSWWGAWLGNCEGKTVIAPARWFAGRDEPPDLIPPNWIRV